MAHKSVANRTVKARKEIRLIESTRILTDLSVAHCVMSHVLLQSALLEREEVTSSDLELKHDFTNSM